MAKRRAPWRRRGVAVALCLAALTGAATSCDGGTKCTLEMRSAFTVSLALPGGKLPPDLVIRLYAPPGTLVIEEDAAQIAASEDDLCGVYPSAAGGQGGGVAAESVFCGWFAGGGDPPWHGALEATAAGYQPVYVELVAQGQGECQKPIPVTAEATLAPL